MEIYKLLKSLSYAKSASNTGTTTSRSNAKRDPSTPMNIYADLPF